MTNFAMKCGICVLAAVTLGSGCSLLANDEVEKLRTEVDALTEQQEADGDRETRIEKLERTVESQRQLLALLQAVHTGDGKADPGKAASMDPDLKKRMDTLGVNLLEQVANDDNMKEAVGSMGQLANEMLKNEIARTKREG